MKFPLRNHLNQRANTLMVTIVTTALLGLVLVSYLGLVSSQNNSIMRSQAWNSAIAIAEAGLEEALTHTRENYKKTLACNGWTLVNGEYEMTRYLGDNYFRTRVTQNQPFRFTSEGYVYLPWNGTYINRTVRVDTISQGVYSKALVVKNSIEMNGNNVGTDSYDSRDLLKSTLGVYDPLKKQANGDVACVDGLVDSLSVGNADIWGRVVTGPTATVRVGPSGSVGSVTWHALGNNGIEDGYWITDMNLNFPKVKKPYDTAPPPSSNANYEAIVENGDYMMSSFSGKLLVKGNATLYVSGSVSMGSQSIIKIQPGASLKLYVGGKDCYIGAVQNDGTAYATNLFIYGLPACKRVDIKYNPNLTGVVYAPDAHLDLNGGMEIFGGIVAKSVKMNGHSKFHYDEALSGEGQPRGFIITSWNEL